MNMISGPISAEMVGGPKDGSEVKVHHLFAPAVLKFPESGELSGMAVHYYERFRAKEDHTKMIYVYKTTDYSS